MRISDWSSDVCSSDLERRLVAVLLVGAGGLLVLVLVLGGGVPVLAGTGLAHRLGDVEGVVFAAELRGDDAHRARGHQVVGGHGALDPLHVGLHRSEEHTSELQSLMRISYAVFCLKNKK